MIEHSPHSDFKDMLHALMRNKPLFYTALVAIAVGGYLLWKNGAGNASATTASTTGNSPSGGGGTYNSYTRNITRGSGSGIGRHPGPPPSQPAPQPKPPVKPFRPGRRRTPPFKQVPSPQPQPFTPTPTVNINGYPIAIPTTGGLNVGPNGIPTWTGGGSASGAWQPAVP